MHALPRSFKVAQMELIRQLSMFLRNAEYAASRQECTKNCISSWNLFKFQSLTSEQEFSKSLLFDRGPVGWSQKSIVKRPLFLLYQRRLENFYYFLLRTAM